MSKPSAEVLAIVEKMKGKKKGDEAPASDEGETEEDGSAGEESMKSNFETLFKLFRGRDCTEEECNDGLEAFKSLVEGC